MTIVIDRVTRVGDIGEPGYSVYGQELPSCTGSGTQDDWHGATQDNLSAVLPTCYITESVYSYLTQDEIESVRSRLQGIFPNDYAYKYYKGRDIFGKQIYCWDFKPDVEARPVPLLYPCEGVVCDDTCVSADKYSQVCVEEGVDAGKCVLDQLLETNSPDCPGYDPCKDVVCEDTCYGVDNWSNKCVDGECVPDALIEPNSTDCGYIPYVCTDGQKRHPTTCWDGSIIHAEVCQNNAWIPTGETCPFEPEPDPCDGVICDPSCVGDDLYENVCSEGVCIRGALIESNNKDICGYVSPEPDPEPETETDWITYILIAAAFILFYIIAKRG